MKNFVALLIYLIASCKPISHQERGSTEQPLRSKQNPMDLKIPGFQLVGTPYQVDPNATETVDLLVGQVQPEADFWKVTVCPKSPPTACQEITSATPQILMPPVAGSYLVTAQACVDGTRSTTANPCGKPSAPQEISLSQKSAPLMRLVTQIRDQDAEAAAKAKHLWAKLQKLNQCYASGLTPEVRASLGRSLAMGEAKFVHFYTNPQALPDFAGGGLQLTESVEFKHKVLNQGLIFEKGSEDLAGLQLATEGLQARGTGPGDEITKYLTDVDLKNYGEVLSRKYDFVQVEAMDSRHLDFSEKFTAAIQTATKRFVGIPFVTGTKGQTNHWVGVLVDQTKKELIYFDSKAIDLDQEARRGIDQVIRQIPGYTTHRLLAKTPNLEFGISEAIQTDGHLCGVYVENFFDYNLAHQDLPFESRESHFQIGSLGDWTESMKAYRQHMTRTLYPDSAAAGTDAIHEFRSAYEAALHPTDVPGVKAILGDKILEQLRASTAVEHRTLAGGVAGGGASSGPAPEPKPQAPESKPQAPESKPQAPKPEPQAPKPELQAPKPELQAPKPEPQAPKPEPQAPEPYRKAKHPSLAVPLFLGLGAAATLGISYFMSKTSEPKPQDPALGLSSDCPSWKEFESL